jgi:hypothetical protein
METLIQSVELEMNCNPLCIQREEPSIESSFSLVCSDCKSRSHLAVGGVGVCFSSTTRLRGRVVKAIDLKSIGISRVCSNHTEVELLLHHASLSSLLLRFRWLARLSLSNLVLMLTMWVHIFGTLRLVNPRGPQSCIPFCCSMFVYVLLPFELKRTS